MSLPSTIVNLKGELLCAWQVMTALSVAKEALQRKESLQPERLAQKALKESCATFTVPEVTHAHNRGYFHLAGL